MMSELMKLDAQQKCSTPKQGGISVIACHASQDS
uniref:Uncharacterized protein n=1 Tax=Anguilla anguilla TaxID=7936 RepID=A0A0E9UZC1_ANGAN